MAWRHNSGFSFHNEVRILPGDTKGIENLAQYIIRNTFSLAKLSYVTSSGTVIYRSKMSHGGNKKNFQTFSALEFIAAITQHIPERMSQMVRYLGWYANFWIISAYMKKTSQIAIGRLRFPRMLLRALSSHMIVAGPIMRGFLLIRKHCDCSKGSGPAM